MGLTYSCDTGAGGGRPSLPKPLEHRAAHLLAVRAAQPLLDLLVRRSDSVCAPHVAHRFERTVPTDAWLPTDRKWTIDEKASASLAEALLYTAARCVATRFDWAVLEFHVLADARAADQHERGHTNVLLVPTRTSTAGRQPVMLLEPNGAAFADRTDALPRLREALAAVAGVSPDAFESVPTLVDTAGVQYELGFAPDGTYDALPICRAVAYWTLHEWIVAGTPSALSQFCATLVHAIRANRAHARSVIVEFMRWARETLDERGADGRSRLGVALDHAVQVDLRALLGAHPRACAECASLVVHMEYSVALGSVEHTGTARVACDR